MALAMQREMEVAMAIKIVMVTILEHLMTLKKKKIYIHIKRCFVSVYIFIPLSSCIYNCYMVCFTNIANNIAITNTTIPKCSSNASTKGLHIYYRYVLVCRTLFTVPDLGG